jgi:hypothetical protein
MSKPKTKAPKAPKPKGKAKASPSVIYVIYG